MGRLRRGWRTLTDSDRRRERLALAFGILTGLFGIAISANEFASSPELDFQAYYFAGQAVLDGEAFVGPAIKEGSFLTDKEYVYAPITVFVFVPFGALPSWQIGYLLNVGLLTAVFYLIGRLNLEYLEGRGVALERVDRWLVLGFCLFSGHAILGVYRGNVDPIMLLLIAGGFLAVERGDQLRGGALWAVAALFKLFPAFLGIWLLYRRAYRAIAAAIVVGLGGLAAGVLVFGIDAHVRFFEFILEERSRAPAFEGGLDPTYKWFTVRRPLSQIAAVPGNLLFVLSAAVVAPVVYVLYRDADSETDRLVAFFATMAALLISVVPSTLNYVTYLFFPLVALLYLLEDRRARRLLVTGLILVSVPVYPQEIALLVDIAPVPPAIGDPIVAGSREILTYASVPLVGFLCFLAAAVRQVRTVPPARDGTDRPVRGD